MGNIDRLLLLADKTNIAETLDKDLLDKIGQKVVREFDADNDSRAEWKKSVEEYIELAKQVVKEKTFPWPNAANVKYPTLLVSALQFHARSYPALIPGKDIVKGRVIGQDMDGQKAERAERIGKHMSYQLTEEMDEWEDDMDRGLLVLPITGCFFKKSYYDPSKARNCSKAVWAQDLVIDYNSPSLDRAPRISEELEFYPQEVKERIASEVWLDTEIAYKDEDAEEPEIFIEQHTTYDLDEDGYKEPYICTVHKDSGKVVRIVARYDEDSIFFMDNNRVTSVGEKNREIAEENAKRQMSNIQAVLIAQKTHDETEHWEDPIQLAMVPEFNFKKKKIVKIEPIQYYTCYPFLPSPDGSVYAMGFGQLLGALSETINTTINQMLDAASLANLQGGLKARGAKAPAGPIKPNIGEYVDIETNGMSIRDVVLPFNFKGPGQASFNLLSMLVESSRDIAGVKDIMTGDSMEGETATTTMIKREEGMRVFNAIYKRLFRSMKDELRKLYRLNRKYLPEESYFRVLDSEEAVKQSDYRVDETDVVPVADPTIATAAQRMIKAQALLNFAGDPDMDGWAIKRRVLEAMEIPNIDEIQPPRPENPEPDPLMVEQINKLKFENQRLLSEVAKNQAATLKTLAEAEAVEPGEQLPQLMDQAKQLGGSGEADESGTGGMVEQPDNEMVPGAMAEGGGDMPMELGPGPEPGEQGQPV